MWNTETRDDRWSSFMSSLFSAWSYFFKTSAYRCTSNFHRLCFQGLIQWCRAYQYHFQNYSILVMLADSGSSGPFIGYRPDMHFKDIGFDCGSPAAVEIHDITELKRRCFSSSGEASSSSQLCHDEILEKEIQSGDTLQSISLEYSVPVSLRWRFFKTDFFRYHRRCLILWKGWLFSSSWFTLVFSRAI